MPRSAAVSFVDWPTAAANRICVSRGLRWNSTVTDVTTVATPLNLAFLPKMFARARKRGSCLSASAAFVSSGTTTCRTSLSPPLATIGALAFNRPPFFTRRDVFRVAIFADTRVQAARAAGRSDRKETACRLRDADAKKNATRIERFAVMTCGTESSTVVQERKMLDLKPRPRDIDR